MSEIAAPGVARPTSLVHDTLTMVGRCVRLSSRQVDALLTSVMLPVM
ncbi:MAG: ABC transporter permease, partial [Dactylosporangium sp.]|nr:ABC transporter permease [Dactylosporangium sp.]